MTSELGRLARGVSEYILLLSATPVHLRSRDLYQLVHLADPATFNRAQAFDDLLAANAPLVEARDLVASGKATREELREILLRATRNRLLRGSRQLKLLLEDLPEEHSMREAAVIAELAWRLENVNLLGHVVTRTRKRDVKEWRVVRDPKVEAVPLTEVERHFYETVTKVVREYCARAAAHEGFLLVMPQRQMSSSMPAALRAWKERQGGSEEEVEEDFGTAVSQEGGTGEPGPVVQELLSRAHQLGDFDLLRRNDSKYDRLRSRLQSLRAREPEAKVVLFSYFRPTLNYLRERLVEDGMEVLVLHGGTEDKDKVIDDFRSSAGGTVLLCSEVASEGIDLQFSWVVINYDLPWNPMKVEQRIGRLDRLGQKSEKVVIWNLFYDQTIDSRIYERIYRRLKLIEGTLGALEPVLGEVIRELALDLLRRDLSAEQEEERIDQTRIALGNIRADEERLEQEAAHLVAYGDYIVNQVNAARELSRRIDGNDLRIYVMDFFRDYYPGCDFRQLTDDLEFEITLSSEAKHNLEEFLRARRLLGQTRLSRVDARQVRCRFENTVVRDRATRAEVINQLHPLVRFVGQRLRELDEQLRPAVAVQIASDDAPEGIPEGVFVFSVQRWSMRGLQETEYLHFAAVPLEAPHETLADELAERLVTAAAANGKDWLSAAGEVDLEQAADLANNVCLAPSEAAYQSRVAQLEAQNEDRAQIQERTLEQHSAVQRRTLEEVLEGHRARGRASLVAATEGKIRALAERMDRRRREIEARRRFEHRAQEICVGLVRVGSAV